MPISSDFLFEQITERLDELSDRQLANLIEVIRLVQVEREDDKIAASVT
jgi:hypothetical protein